LTSTSAQEAADRLIELSNEYGGLDNVSAIMVRVTQKSDGMLERLKVWKRNSG
jgi:serine/threonine protein phosphatase PrpC